MIASDVSMFWKGKKQAQGLTPGLVGNAYSIVVSHLEKIPLTSNTSRILREPSGNLLTVDDGGLSCCQTCDGHAER